MLSQDALRRALESGETAYDTVSVELALKTYPDIAKQRKKDLT